MVIEAHAKGLIVLKQHFNLSYCFLGIWLKVREVLEMEGDCFVDSLRTHDDILLLDLFLHVEDDLLLVAW